MKILRVEPGKSPFEKDIQNTLEGIQAEVEGLFQPLCLENGTILCCNEEGKFNGMEMNRRLKDEIICGPFFIVGEDDNGEFRSLTDQEVQDGMEQFGEIEQFADYEPVARPRYEIYGFTM